MIRNHDGGWIDDGEEIKSMTMSFFFNIFKEEIPSRGSIIFGQNFMQCDDEKMARLDDLPTIEELKGALFSMGGTKAPGNNGFLAIFFQKNWHIVKSKMFEVVMKIFKGEINLGDINQTLVVLIPKIDNPELITQFRPISLFNVIYKCIYKIIVNKIKVFL